MFLLQICRNQFQCIFIIFEQWPRKIINSTWGDLGYLEYTLAGIIIEALSIVWDANISDILLCSLNYKDKTVKNQNVAILPNGKKMEGRVEIIRNPNVFIKKNS